MKCGQRMQLFSFHGIAKESILPPAAIRFRAEKRQRVPWCTAICTINPPSTMARARLQLPTAADQTATWLCPQANILASFLPCCYENSRFCSPFFHSLPSVCVGTSFSRLGEQQQSQPDSASVYTSARTLLPLLLGCCNAPL